MSTIPHIPPILIQEPDHHECERCAPPSCLAPLLFEAKEKIQEIVRAVTSCVHPPHIATALSVATKNVKEIGLWVAEQEKKQRSAAPRTTIADIPSDVMNQILELSGFEYRHARVCRAFRTYFEETIDDRRAAKNLCEVNNETKCLTYQGIACPKRISTGRQAKELLSAVEARIQRILDRVQSQSQIQMSSPPFNLDGILKRSCELIREFMRDDSPAQVARSANLARRVFRVFDTQPAALQGETGEIYYLKCPGLERERRLVAYPRSLGSSIPTYIWISRFLTTLDLRHSLITHLPEDLGTIPYLTTLQLDPDFPDFCLPKSIADRVLSNEVRPSDQGPCRVVTLMSAP